MSSLHYQLLLTIVIVAHIVTYNVIATRRITSNLTATFINASIEYGKDGVAADLRYGGNTLIFNTTKMMEMLRQLDYLTIYLNHTLEFENNFVQFLLAQKVCPLQILIGRTTRLGTYANVKRLKLKFYIPSLHRAVSVRAGDLHSTLIRYVSKNGILFCLVFGQLNMMELKETAAKLWKDNKIFRIYYITHVRTWFYNPFARSVGDDGFGEIIDANNIHIMNSIFTNMNGYPMRTYIFNSAFSTVFGDSETETITTVKGVDSETALLLGDRLNFTLQFQWPDSEFFGARLENGSFNGAIGRIMRDETDIVMSGFFIKDYLTREITFTVAVYMDELCCYVAKAPRVPQSILPIFAVNVDIWIGFFLVGLLTPFIWMLLRYLNLLITKKTKGSIYWISAYSYKSHFQYVRIFNDIWVLWVRCSILRFPPFYSERIFVVSLCLVSVIYGALFESSLATVYIRPIYYKDIDTLQDLDKAGYRIYIKHAAMMDDIFIGHSSPVYQHLNRKLLLVGQTEERLISMMAKRGGFAAVTRGSALLLDDIRYFITKKIHKVPECPKNYHIGFVVPRYSPFEEPFNIKLLYFLQAGFINVWSDQTMHQAKTRIHTFSDYNTENEHFWIVLTLKDLQLAFYALGLGCTLASMSLLVEIFFKFKYK